MSDTDLSRKLTDTLAELVAYDTSYPPARTDRLCAAIAPRLEAWGYRVRVLREVEGLDNIVASIGESRPHPVFNAHADTVGVGDRARWESDPFTLTQRGDQLFGLGASNCKASMAIHLWLAEQLALRGGPARGQVTFTFVTDEESLGPHGMDFLRRAGHVAPDGLLLGAPTGNQFVTAERGVLWAAVETFGKAAHAGLPERDDNAIERMLRLVEALQRELYPRLAARQRDGLRSTVNLGQFHGGANTNVVPNRCRIELDRRLLPREEAEAAFAEIEAVLRDAGEPEDLWRAEMMRGTNGFASSREGVLVRSLTTAHAEVAGRPAPFMDAIGVSDGRYFANDGCEIVNFGPGDGGGHAENGSVSLADMIAAARIQEAFLRHFEAAG